MSEETTQARKKGNGPFIAIIFILFIALAAMSYLWSVKNGQLNDAQNENKKLKADMKAMNEMLSGYVGDMSNDLQKDFMAMLRTYDELKANGTPEQNKEIEEQQAEIQRLMAEVERGKLNGYQLMKVRAENEELRKIMRGYVVEIDQLRTENMGLTNELDSTNTVLTNTQDERDNLATQVDEYSAKVKEGQKMSAYGFSSVGLRQKLNNTMTETTRAKNVVQIKSSFTIGANPITDPGKKDVYLQVIDPAGKTLQGSSGNILQTDKGKVPFSDKKQIDYKNQSVDMAIFYSLRGTELTKGNYKVRIYCQGQLIGSDSFTLK